MNQITDAPGYSMDEQLSTATGLQLRRVSFERTYIIHYRVDEAKGLVEVVNFRHGARRPGLDD